MVLYRPLIATEFKEVEARDFQSFPPRAEEQPLFTALLSEEGASRIASRMRLEKPSDNKVYVVSFLVDDAYIRQFPVHKSAERDSAALWIPAEDMEILNQHLIGNIQVLSSYVINREDGDLFFA